MQKLNCDVDQKNNPASHFELYVESMKKIGSSTNLIEKFVRKIKETKDYNLSKEGSSLPEGITKFLDFTFDVTAIPESKFAFFCVDA